MAPTKPVKKAGKVVDKLEKLRQKLAQTTSGSKGYMSLKEGSSVIRILPPVGGMEYFYQEVGKHTLSDDKWAYCPEVLSEGEQECPICDLQKQLYAHGDKELAKKIRVARKYWMNVIDRGNEDAGPLILTAGITILQQIAGYVNDPDYGDITDPDEGWDITIDRKGKGMDTRYDVRVKPRSSPLSADEDVASKWLEEARDLTPVGLSDDPEEDSEITEGRTLWYSTYDRISKDFKLDEYEEVEYSEEEEIEEEYEEEEELPEPEPEPVRKPVQRIQRKHTR